MPCVVRLREGGSLAIIITCMGQAISDKPRCCAQQMLCERLIVSKCCCRWRQLSDCLMPPGERGCVRCGHDCCLLKSWLLSTWPMASQFVMCAINYKAEKGTPIAKPKRAMKCAVTSNNELATHSLSPSKKAQPNRATKVKPHGRACVCDCVWVNMYACHSARRVSQASSHNPSLLLQAAAAAEQQQHWR